MRYLFHIFLLLSCLASHAQTPLDLTRQKLANGDYKGCRELLDSCAAKAYQPDSVLFYKGLVAVKSGEPGECLNYCVKLQKSYPDFYDVHYLRGLSYFQTENYGRSADEFTRVLEKNPRDLKALFDRSVALGMLEKYTSAINDLTSCIEIDARFGKAYYSRAYWYEFTGNYFAAARDYELSIQLEPRNFDAYFGLAFIYKIQDDNVKACEVINNAIHEGSQIAEELKDGFCR